MAGEAAAYFRVEGTLIARGALSQAAYFAANAQGLRERVLRLGAVALAAPVLKVWSQSDRGIANRMAYFACREMTEDRLAILGEEYYDLYIKDKVLDRGLELVKRARREGYRIVLLSEGLEPVMERLGDEVGGADALVCNRLEFRRGRATGRLLEPIVAGPECGAWVRKDAAERGIALERSRAYASHGGDVLLLTSVGEPCAANPDFALRRMAREMDWPVVDYEA